MTIKLLKLVTGEEIVAEMSNTKQGQFQLKTPVTIRVYPSQISGGQPSLGFAPWPSFADLTKPVVVNIEPLHVAYYYTPNSELISEYNGLVTELSGGSKSGIITG